jgi:hypothetical protein
MCAASGPAPTRPPSPPRERLGQDSCAAGSRIDGDDITVEVAGRTLSGQRLDHDFPDYRRVLRTSAAHRVDIHAATIRAELASAPLRTLHRKDDDSDRAVSVFTLGPDGTLGFAPRSEALLEIGLDREFLLQALDAGGAGQLVLELDGPIAPLAIRNPTGPATSAC